MTFGKPQCLGHFIKEIVFYMPGHSSDTDSHLLYNLLKSFWDSLFIFKEYMWSIGPYKRKGLQPPQRVPEVIHKASLGNTLGLKIPIAQLTEDVVETSAALPAKLMHRNNWWHFSALGNSSGAVRCCWVQPDLRCPWIHSTWATEHLGHKELGTPCTPMGVEKLSFPFCPEKKPMAWTCWYFSPWC